MKVQILLNGYAIKKPITMTNKRGCTLHLPKEFIDRFVKISFLNPDEERRMLEKEIEFEKSQLENKEKLEKLHKDLEEIRKKRKEKEI